MRGSRPLPIPGTNANHLVCGRFKRRYLLADCIGENSDERLQRLEHQRQRSGWD